MRYIELSQGKVAIVDDDKYAELMKYKWHYNSNGYARTSNPKAYMYRLLRGNPDSEVDHKNGNRLDNRINNLRSCTSTQNSANSSTRITNKTGIKGVCFDNNRGKWLAQIGYRKKNKHIGRFDTKEEATRAYQDAAVRLFGEFARLGNG